MPDIVITPNRGTSSNPKIDFTGTSAGTIKLEVLGDGTIAWNGANGSLFSIADSLSGSLMSVNDISGLPAFEVFSDNRVVVGQFGANLLLGKTTSSSNGRLQLADHTAVTGGIGFGTDVGLYRIAANKLAFRGTADAEMSLRFNRAGGSYTTTWENYIPAASTDLRWFNGADKFTLTASGNATFSGYVVGTSGFAASGIYNYAFLQVTDSNNFWITPGNNQWGLYFETAAGGLLGGTGDSNRLGFVGNTNARFYVDLNNGNGWFGGGLTVTGTTTTAKLNVAGYSMRSSATIDMSNTAVYSTSNFYPVTIPLGGYAGYQAMPVRMRILNSLNSNVPSWSTHGSGFTCHVEWTTNGSGWGTIAVQRAIHRYTEGFTSSTICGGISQLTNDSIEVIWLRGGGIYYFEADADVTPTPRSTNYTAPNGETANVVSVAVNNVIESALSTRPSFSRLNLAVGTGTAPMTVSSTTLVTNLNADLLDGLNSATASTANTIAARDASGFISAVAIQTSSGGSNGVRVHSNSGITASGNYMNLFSSQTNGWAFNANGTGADANTVATISASGNANINGIVGTSGGKLSLGILDINSSGTPSYIKINTTIPAGSTSSDFTVTIKGFYYNSARSMEIRVSWHYYLSQFWNACATSSGGWAPEIKLSEEGGFVKITLTSPGYWPKLFVESVYSSAYGSSYSTGWSWTDAAATNSPVTVTYVSDFGNSNYAFTSGLYAINFVDTNNSNYWCDPNGTSILRNIQIGSASGGGPGLISIWEAEDLNRTGGTINSDASASSGQNWGTNTNTQLYGPYVNLPRGNYRFTARIKVADASYTGNSVRIQVLPIASKVVSQDRYIRGVDFSGNDVWETFSIPFKVIASTSSDVEFYVFGLNSKQIYVDYVAIFLDTDSHTQQVWGNLYANGNVGIGTTTPNYKLELSGTVGLSGFSGGSYRKLATPSYWGYSNSYKSIILGSSSTTYNTNDGAVTLCFGVDVSGNANESFTGDGRELVFRNLTKFVTPNGSNDNYLNPLTFNNGSVGVAIDSPSFKFQVAGAGSIGDGAFIVSGNTASSSFYDQNTGAYFHTPGAMIRKDSSRTTPQTSEATLVLYNKNGTDATNTKLVFANNETTSTSANPVATAAIVSEKVSGTAGSWAVGNLQFLVKNGANYTNSVVIDNTGVTVAGALTVQDGTASTNVFGLTTFTKSLTVTTSWSDVGISGSDLATGTYIIQVTVDNYDVSGGQYQERYSGVMSWISTTTNSTDVDEIVLHKAGHAPNGNWINLRTVRQAPNLTMKLQIIASGNTSAADNYVFKFRRMI